VLRGKMQNAINIARKNCKTPSTLKGKKCKTPLRTAVKIVNASNSCQQEGMI
jgi:hypothetical protein